jgi:hypothetical protein
MRLEIEGCAAQENPGDQAIAEGLASLTGKGAEFAILSRDQMTYVQVWGSGAKGFDLEYQDGSRDKHYRCAQEVSLAAVTKIYCAYARGDGSWRAGHKWEPMTKDRAGGDFNWRESWRNRYVGARAYDWALVALVVATFLARKKLGDGATEGIILCSAAAWITMGNTAAMKSGVVHVGSSIAWHSVTRKAAPVRFWMSIGGSYAVAFVLVLFVALRLLGKIPGHFRR